MVSILLKNNNTEVVVSLIENMDELVNTVGVSSIEDKVIPSICTLASDKTWRIRLAAVCFFPKMAKAVGKDLFQIKLESVLIGLLMDPVFSIREQAMQSMIDISKQYQNPDWLVRISREKIQEFSKHERFMIRI